MFFLSKILPIVLMVLFTFSNCSNKPETIQNFQPTSDVSLEKLLELIPILSSSFDNIEAYEFNEKLSSFLNIDPTTSVFLLLKLSELIKDDPQLPKIVDNLSGPLHDFGTYYQEESREEEFHVAISSIGKLLSSNPSLLKQLLLVLSKSLYSMSSQEVLY